LSVSSTFAKHPDSKLHCIDPFVDYDGYNEYRGKGEQDTNYETFISNIQKDPKLYSTPESGSSEDVDAADDIAADTDTASKELGKGKPTEKFTFYRDFSFIQLPKLLRENSYQPKYNLIYIDGNHEPEAVLEDAVLAWRLLQPNGVMIFDDYFPDTWGPLCRAVDNFVNTMVLSDKALRVSGTQSEVLNGQVFVMKKGNMETQIVENDDEDADTETDVETDAENSDIDNDDL